MNYTFWPPWWLGLLSPFVRVFCLLLRMNELDPFFANNTATGLLEVPKRFLIEPVDLFGIANPKRSGVCRWGQYIKGG